jgi:hypothetical protein
MMRGDVVGAPGRDDAGLEGECGPVDDLVMIRTEVEVPVPSPRVDHDGHGRAHREGIVNVMWG